MFELPDYLAQGEEARLIPVTTGNHKERAACSVLLATLRIVEPFAQAVFAEMGKRVGRRTAISSYTEVIFVDQPNEAICRHDGLLVLKSLRSEWRALVECKIGTARIDSEQVARYCRVAKENGIDAVITISNEPTARRTHLPYAVTRDARNIELYHWSWSRLVAIADCLLESDEEFDDEQQLILREMVRYFDYDSSDVRDFNQMGPSWSSVVQKVVAGGSLARNDPDIVEAVRSWHQAQEAVCVRRTREWRLPVSVWLARAHRDDWDARIAEDVNTLIEENSLYGSFEIPNLAGPLVLVANVMARNLVCHLELQAPRDRQRYASRLRWLMNQLPDDTDLDAVVECLWERGIRSRASVAELRRNPDAARVENAGSPNYFDVAIVTDLNTRFAGNRNFVSALDESIAHFYSAIARHVRGWQPSGGLSSDSDLESNLTDARNERQVTQRGEVHGCAYSIFTDGSIEIETRSGIQRFNSLAELNAAAAAKDGRVRAPKPNS